MWADELRTELRDDVLRRLFREAALESVWEKRRLEVDAPGIGALDFGGSSQHDCRDIQFRDARQTSGVHGTSVNSEGRPKFISSSLSAASRSQSQFARGFPRARPRIEYFRVNRRSA